MKIIFALLSLLTTGMVTVTGQDFQVMKDLQPEWQAYEDGKFVPYASRSSATEVVYFSLPSRPHAGQLLSIKSAKPLSLFINNRFSTAGKNFELAIDSLAKVAASTTLLVALYQDDMDTDALATTIGVRKPVHDDFLRRQTSGFKDFAILAVLILATFAIVIVRLNPKLASDYFSIGKIVSAREIDDAQTYTRIASSTNILFYIYSSMLLAYYLVISFHFVTDSYPVALAFQQDEFVSIFAGWLRVGGIVLLLLFVKIVLVFGLSFLFGIPEIAGVHFFNWVRLVLVVIGTLSIFLFIYLLWHGQNPGVYSVMLKLLGWFTLGWMILIFLKLNGRTGASMFHLFSYICATELIPFLFIVKVLYN
jgi:hypothetical protein